ncbi:tail tape measure protein [Sphingobium phenoxybenzoativorans]|uniref:Tail tape measure protein n=1 Tax=Sphingobium phenoxybenzoativorans TaxID=1592790 RepID=A0A975K7M7_9SPHN|nr:tail tape measure protein [Sphingobium phenoxybenzoativorans]QUT06300.1 tail tape measure protein [Sphingobium phenoxybenzoativorans]
MDEEIERLVVSVRADTQSFARDVEAMRTGLEGPLEAGANRAGRAIEAGLLRAVKTGKFGFEDLARVAAGVLDAIAASALRAGIGSVLGGGGGAGGGAGLLGIGASLIGSALGLPGRATGGPVSPGRGYLVGERGPELFVPTSSGRVVPSSGGGARDVRVTVNVNAAGGEAPQALARSARQVARAVRGALSE